MKPRQIFTSDDRKVSRYRFKKRKVKPNVRAKELTRILMLLSGSKKRFIQLILRKGRERPEINKVAVKAASDRLSVSVDDAERHHNEVVVEGEEEVKRQIDERYYRIMQSIYAEAINILGLE